MNPKRGLTKAQRMHLYRQKQLKKRKAFQDAKTNSSSTRPPVAVSNASRFGLSFDTLCRVFGGKAKTVKKEELSANDSTAAT